MKKLIVILLAVLLTGCAVSMGDDTTASGAPSQTPSATQTSPSLTDPEPTGNIVGTAETDSAMILGMIWEEFAEDEKFAAYGGTVEHAVSDAPGDLDLQNTDELTTKYLLPEDQLPYVEEGASLVHLMNSNIFTGAVFRIRGDTTLRSFAQAVRKNLQTNPWICGQPDRLLIADTGGNHLLMAFGSSEIMHNFRQKLMITFQGATILHDETISS